MMINDRRARSRITWRKIYRVGGPNLRHQVVLTLALVLVAAIGLCAYSVFATETGVSTPWLTPANIIAAGGVMFSLGMLREQFGEVKQRLEELEEFNRTTLPETYARKDVIEAAGKGGNHEGRR